MIGLRARASEEEEKNSNLDLRWWHKFKERHLLDLQENERRSGNRVEERE